MARFKNERLAGMIIQLDISCSSARLELCHAPVDQEGERRESEGEKQRRRRERGESERVGREKVMRKGERKGEMEEGGS